MYMPISIKKKDIKTYYKKHLHLERSIKFINKMKIYGASIYIESKFKVKKNVNGEKISYSIILKCLPYRFHQIC